MKRVLATLVVFPLMTAGLVAQDPKLVADGKKVYDNKKCSECHYIAGKGKQKMSELDEVGAKLSEADIRKWLTDPTSMEAKLDHKPKVKMSSKKVALTPAEVDALAAYMLSLKVKK